MRVCKQNVGTCDVQAASQQSSAGLAIKHRLPPGRSCGAGMINEPCFHILEIRPVQVSRASEQPPTAFAGNQVRPVLRPRCRAVRLNKIRFGVLKRFNILRLTTRCHMVLLIRVACADYASHVSLHSNSVAKHPQSCTVAGRTVVSRLRNGSVC